MQIWLYESVRPEFNYGFYQLLSLEEDPTHLLS